MGETRGKKRGDDSAFTITPDANSAGNLGGCAWVSTG